MPVATKYFHIIKHAYYSSTDSSSDAMSDLDVVEFGLLLLFDSIERLALLVTMLAIIFSCLALILFVTQGVALYKIAKQQAFAYPWLAWIPVAHLFVIPLLIENNVYAQFRGKFTSFFGVMFAVSAIIASVTGWGWLMGIPTGLLLYGFHTLVKSYSEDYPLHTWLAVVTLGVSVPFQLLRFSNSKRQVRTI